MKFMNMRYLHNYMEEADDGKGGSGGGGDEPTLEELQASLAELKKSNESLVAKNSELLSETKKAKNLKRESEEAARKAAEEKAKASNDYEQLHKSAMAELEKEREEKNKLLSGINNEKVNNTAMKLATELADGYNAELLSESIAKRLKVSDGEIKVLDENGGLTVSTLEDLKNTFKGNERFASLLKGNQSGGGGAGGGDKGNGGGATKTMTRAEFENLEPVAAAKFTKEGGQVTDS